MQLVSAHINKFRNIIDSGSFPVQSDVTCLVGKNEAGKTAILRALERLNPSSSDQKFDKRNDYPRWLVKSDKRNNLSDAIPPVTATFLLDTEDTDFLVTNMQGFQIVKNTFSVSRGYDNELKFEINLDSNGVLKSVLEAATTDLQEFAKLTSTLEDFYTLLNKLLNKTESPLSKEASAILTEKEWIFNKEKVLPRMEAYLTGEIPLFFYFDQYSELPGRFNMAPILEAIAANTDKNLPPAGQTCAALLRMTGAAASELKSDNFEVRSTELEAVANDLTADVLEYWSQNPYIRLTLEIDPLILNPGYSSPTIQKDLLLRVYDERHKFSNSLDSRSTGFRWFVSFLAAFSEFKTDDRQIIILLDEPGLSLHGKAQADLMRFIVDHLALDSQVIYTTHSPFMVESGHLERVRTVEDSGPEVGTKVSQKILARDPDTLFPLQAALGYDIAQNLFITPHNLVVEGVTDYTYLTVLSSHLEGLGRSYLSEKWTIMPVGGGTNIPTFVALLHSHLNFTVLLDDSAQVVKRMQKITENSLVTEDQIIVTTDIVDVKGADLEDLFEAGDYLKLYNEAHGKKHTKSSLKGNGPILRRLESVDGEFRGQHMKPSDVLMRTRDKALAGMSAITLDNFESLFKKINKTLPPEK